MARIHGCLLFTVALALLLTALQCHGQCYGSGRRQHGIPEYIIKVFQGPRPRFRVVPTDQTVTAGDEFAQFHCVPCGGNDLRVEWKIVSPDGEVVVGDKHQVSEDGHCLNILEPMEFNDGFEVQCFLVAPYHDQPLKATAKLFVRPPCPPTIVARPRSGKYKAGSRIVLECAAHGWPLPRIAWMFLSRRHRVKRFFERDQEYPDFIKEPNRVIILSMNPNTEGTYVCIAFNKLGHAKAQANVGFDRRSVRRINTVQLLHRMRYAQHRQMQYSHHSEQKLGRKATCRMEVMNHMGMLDSVHRNVDSSTATYDYLVGLLDREQQYSHNCLPGEALNIDLALLNYIRANLNCSSSAVPAPDCHRHMDFLSKYPSPDGSCNNLRHPTWGQAGMPLGRNLQSQYERGINLPQGFSPHQLYGGHHKPSARLVSVKVLRQQEYLVDSAISQAFNFFGQFVDHDMSLVPGSSTDRGTQYNSDCNVHCRVDLPCFPIPAPRNDPRLSGCIPFKRSGAFCSTGDFGNHQSCIRPREQINQVSNFLDASMVYGSNCRVMNLLREPNSPQGYLKSSDPAPGQKLRLLPIDIDGVPTACGVNSDAPTAKCYNGGDLRINGFFMLTVQNTMWMREHNRIGHKLHKMNPHWCPDKVFFEARRIVAAQLQQITYNEYLPLLLGVTGMRKLVGPYDGYRSDVNPSIDNAFTTAAFRIGHSMISDVFAKLNEDYHLMGTLPLEHGVLSPDKIAKYGIDCLLRGTLTMPVKSQCSGPGSMGDGIVDRLFELTAKVASDLASLDIQRGRDHGLPSYNYWRVLCGLQWATEWEHLRGEIRNPHALEKLKKVYGSPENIDLIVAIVLEDRVDDAMVGPTARCLLAKQFKAVRDGDRFWFENSDYFNRAQVQELRRSSFSRLVCNTVETINRIQPWAFLIPKTPADLVPCSELPDFDLNLWKDHDESRKCVHGNPCGESGSAPPPPRNYEN